MIELYIVTLVLFAGSTYLVARLWHFETASWWRAAICGFAVASVLFSLYLALYRFFPGPYPAIATHPQEQHELNVFFLSAGIAIIALYLAIRVMFRQSLGRTIAALVGSTAWSLLLFGAYVWFRH